MIGVKVTRMLGPEPRLTVQVLDNEVQIDVHPANDHVGGCTIDISADGLAELLLRCVRHGSPMPKKLREYFSGTTDEFGDSAG